MSTRRRKKSPRYGDELCLSHACPSAIIVEESQKNNDNNNNNSILYVSSHISRKGRTWATNKKTSDFITSSLITSIFLMMTLVVLMTHLYSDNLSILSKINSNQSVMANSNQNPCTCCNDVLHQEERIIEKRIFFYYPDLNVKSQRNQEHKRGKNHYTTDPMLHVNRGEETIKQPLVIKDVNNNCVPMQQWQTKTYPTCNSVHELDQLSGISRSGKTSLSSGTKISYRNDNFHLIGSGWFRNTWKVEIGSSSEFLVLKTLRFERDFLQEYFELHRRESTAMERLSTSPYIIDIYSFCGQSIVNEFADFIDGFRDFKNFAKQLRGNNEKKILHLKLQIATMIALGVQHIHEVDGPNNASLAHYDLNPMNIVITAGGIPKINDFNVAEFIFWDSKKMERCGFNGRFKEPWWRSPEEMSLVDKLNATQVPLLDEKVDIYALGNIIYNLMTGHTPRGATSKERIKQVQKQVQEGIRPELDKAGPKYYSTSDNPLIISMREAMEQCYQSDPAQRSSARDIANILYNVLIDSQDKN